MRISHCCRSVLASCGLKTGKVAIGIAEGLLSRRQSYIERETFVAVRIVSVCYCCCTLLQLCGVDCSGPAFIPRLCGYACVLPPGFTSKTPQRVQEGAREQLACTAVSCSDVTNIAQ